MKHKEARSCIGSTVHHDGADGRITDYLPTTYAVPMFVVEFAGGRRATLKVTEIGSR